MKNILIFRTDRIGDFLVCSSIYSSIKRKNKNCSIDIVCSNSNFKYINSFNFFNNVYLYPKNLTNKFLFYFKLKKYDEILVLDGKKRSIYFSIFKKSKSKIMYTPSKFIKNIFFFFFDCVFLIDYKKPKINLIKKSLLFLNYDFVDTDLNFLKKHENSNYLNYNIPFNDYLIFNFDEKWFYNNYIRTYCNIEPHYDEFIEFLKKISASNNVVITNGYKQNYILDRLKITVNTDFKNKVLIKDKINIFELQNLIKNSKCLISCHGAPSHIASSYNIKLIDIIDNSEKDFFESYNFHFKKKSQLIRQKFNILSNQILAVI